MPYKVSVYNKKVVIRQEKNCAIFIDSFVNLTSKDKNPFHRITKKVFYPLKSC